MGGIRIVVVLCFSGVTWTGLGSQILASSWSEMRAETSVWQAEKGD